MVKTKFSHIKHKRNSEEIHNCLDFLSSSQKEPYLTILYHKGSNWTDIWSKSSSAQIGSKKYLWIYVWGKCVIFYGIKTSGKGRLQTYKKIKLQSNFLEDDGIKVRGLLVIALNK